MNVNDPCWVVLTPAGWEQFDKAHTDLGMDPSPYRVHLRRVGEWVEFQLWDLMHTFGPAMHMGATRLPFRGNEILFEKPDVPS